MHCTKSAYIDAKLSYFFLISAAEVDPQPEAEAVAEPVEEEEPPVPEAASDPEPEPPLEAAAEEPEEPLAEPVEPEPKPEPEVEAVAEREYCSVFSS